MVSVDSILLRKRSEFDEKYILEGSVDDPEEEQTYYIVHEDYIEFHRYKEYSTYPNDNIEVTHYTVKYKYTVVDEGSLVCFYDSFEIHDDHDADERPSTFKSELLMFSENVIMNQAMDMYIRESYLKDELKNYGK